MKEWLTPFNYESGNSGRKYIVIHDTGNYVDSAWNNANYFNQCDRGASANYFVDAIETYRIIRDEDTSWHCGDGGGAYGITNYNSIGIEMCNSGGYTDPITIRNTIALVKSLMTKYNIPLANVVRHYDASRKECPHNLMANNWAKWSDFKKSLGGQATSGGEYFESGVIAYGYVNSSDGLNIRATPNGVILGALANGTPVKIAKESNGWYDIYWGSCGGYIKKEFVTITSQKTPPKPVSKPSTPTTPQGQIYYRVICGSYTERKNAEEMQKKLADKGYKSFLANVTKDGKNFLRVVCDSYIVKDNAVLKQKELKGKGFDSFLEAFKK